MAGLRVITGGEDQRLGIADYVWIDWLGVPRVRTRTIPVASGKGADVPILEPWTTSSSASDEQTILSVCHYLPDPVRPQPSFIALCEVRDPQNVPTDDNKRAALREHTAAKDSRFWWGIRQPYLLEPRGLVNARAVAERHLAMCVDAGIMIHSAQHDDILGHWDFKVGCRGLPTNIDPEPPVALVVADHVWIARYLLSRAAREMGLKVAYPHGSVGSVFFSSEDMRNKVVSTPDVVTEVRKYAKGLTVRSRLSLAFGGRVCIEIRGFKVDADPYVTLNQSIQMILIDTGESNAKKGRDS